MLYVIVLVHSLAPYFHCKKPGWVSKLQLEWLRKQYSHPYSHPAQRTLKPSIG